MKGRCELRSTCSSGREDPRTQRRWRCAWALVAILVAAPPARADEGAADGARQHFRAGVTLLQDPDGARYEEAYREFQKAYELLPSPNILGNLGYCALKLERDKEAIEAYERYLREAPDIEPQEKKQVEADLLTLRAGLVRVTLTIDPPGGAIVDRRIPTRGDPIVNGYGSGVGKVELAVRAGRHVIEVRSAGADAQSWQFEAMPGGHVQHTFARVRPEPQAPPPAPSKTVPIVVTSLGAATLAAGTISGIVALNRAKRIENACPNDTCPAGYGLDSQRSSTYTLVRATDILLIGGGVVTASGLVWLFLSGSSSSSKTPTAAAACTGTGCGAYLSGRF